MKKTKLATLALSAVLAVGTLGVITGRTDVNQVLVYDVDFSKQCPKSGRGCIQQGAGRGGRCLCGGG